MITKVVVFEDLGLKITVEKISEATSEIQKTIISDIESEYGYSMDRLCRRLPRTEAITKARHKLYVQLYEKCKMSHAEIGKLCNRSRDNITYHLGPKYKLSNKHSKK